MRILVVDDDETNRLVARLLLISDGHNVIDAANGQAALESMDNLNFDLVLMDLSMPGMDGFETVRKYRASAANCKQLPIIALTSHSSAADRQRCLEVGMNAMILKPLNVRHIKELLKNLPISA